MYCAFTALAASAAVAATLALPPASFAQHRVRAGTLNCDVSGGIGMIITSKKQVRCVYTDLTLHPECIERR